MASGHLPENTVSVSVLADTGLPSARKGCLKVRKSSLVTIIKIKINPVPKSLETCRVEAEWQGGSKEQPDPS